jgi:hypothetical protein
MWCYPATDFQWLAVFKCSLDPGMSIVLAVESYIGTIQAEIIVVVIAYKTVVTMEI